MSAKLERNSLLHKRYRIVEVLGQGGMGSVYRAVDENLGVDVAVKENLFTSDEFAQQFRLEAVILANLRHPNLTRVTDHFVIDGQGQYLIMDFIDGEDLRHRMERNGSISEEEVILVGVAMCDALQYLHTRKPSIIHRDLKPGNVRISHDGHIFLVDFGLAKLIKGDQATTTGARAMTPGYSPPEQYGAGRTDPRTDIYSLGATLYAALSGVIPEDGLARAMEDDHLTPLQDRNPKVSPKLAATIEKAMAVHQEERFQSAEEFRKILLSSSLQPEHLEGEIIVAPPPQQPESRVERNLSKEMPKDPGNNQVPPPPPPKTPGKPRSASWWIFFSFFLLTIVAALLSILVFWSPITKAFLEVLTTPTSTQTSTPTPLAATLTALYLNSIPASLTPTSTKTPPPSATFTWTPLPTFTPSITPTPTVTFTPSPTSLGGGYSQIAFASDRTGKPQIYVMNADGTNQRQVTIMPNGACQPGWSPDGARLIFISPCLKRGNQYPESKIYISNADGSGLTEMASEMGGDFNPTWSPDGTRIAFTSIRDGSPQIYVLNLGDNKVTRLTEKTSDVHLPDWSIQPAWSPNGAQISYTGHGPLTDALQVWVMSDTGLNKELMVPRGSDLWNFLPCWSSNGETVLFSETMGAQELGWLMSFDSLTKKVIHLRLGANGTHCEYSPDGLWIVYENKDNEDSTRLDYDIYRIQADRTGIIIRLTTALSMEFDPAWRPIFSP